MQFFLEVFRALSSTSWDVFQK